MNRTTILARLPIAFLTILITFTASAQRLYQYDLRSGVNPSSGLVVDGSGNFYGVTYSGGSANVGVVYEMSATTNGAVETVLYNFTGNSGNGDGANPVGNLVIDQAGNLFGTTQYGGNLLEGDCGLPGCGTVFELSPPSTSGGVWTEIILYAFQGNHSDAVRPEAGLTFDASGNLFGTTPYGGIVNAFCPCGTIFELSPPASQGGAWTETILYAFQGGFDGSTPFAGVTFDPAGNLYGTTSVGGEGFNGTVFELSPPIAQGDPWSETVLHSFINNDGIDPQAGLTLAPDGSLLGTTCTGGIKDRGTVFRLKPRAGGWLFQLVYSFLDAGGPRAGLTLGNGNLLYGTLSSGDGTVFEISIPGGKVTYTVLYNFGGNVGVASPVILYRGALYGTTTTGGHQNNGTAYRLTR